MQLQHLPKMAIHQYLTIWSIGMQQVKGNITLSNKFLLERLLLQQSLICLQDKFTTLLWLLSTHMVKETELYQSLFSLLKHLTKWVQFKFMKTWVMWKLFGLYLLIEELLLINIKFNSENTMAHLPNMLYYVMDLIQLLFRFDNASYQWLLSQQL